MDVLRQGQCGSNLDQALLGVVSSGRMSLFIHVVTGDTSHMAPLHFLQLSFSVIDSSSLGRGWNVMVERFESRVVSR